MCEQSGIDRVDSGRPYPDEHFAGTRARDAHVGHRKDVRPPCWLNRNARMRPRI
jgi:hypothetical protein